jgi:hypothetical protein
LATQFGFVFWKLINGKYMKHLRLVSRQLKKNRISQKVLEKLREFGSIKWLEAIQPFFKRERDMA